MTATTTAISYQAANALSASAEGRITANRVTAGMRLVLQDNGLASGYLSVSSRKTGVTVLVTDVKAEMDRAAGGQRASRRYGITWTREDNGATGTVWTAPAQTVTLAKDAKPAPAAVAQARLSHKVTQMVKLAPAAPVATGKPASAAPAPAGAVKAIRTYRSSDALNDAAKAAAAKLGMTLTDVITEALEALVASQA